MTVAAPGSPPEQGQLVLERCGSLMIDTRVMADFWVFRSRKWVSFAARIDCRFLVG
jgi:hypothetical protein